MSTTSKSPIEVAEAALMVATRTLPMFSHQFSPKKFSLPQLLTILVIKKLLKVDYRGVTIMLRDWPELAKTIELKSVPHYTTLQKASKRILAFDSAMNLLYATAEYALENPANIDLAAIDSTGLETGHISPYFLERCNNGRIPIRNTRMTKWPKLALIADTKTHVILTALATYGPCSDSAHFKDAIELIPDSTHIKKLLADAGYDSEKNHVLANEIFGIETVIPPTIGPKRQTLPKKPYRRKMATEFDHESYRHRVQVETVMSMIKRNLGDALAGRSEQSRNSEMILMTIAHNVMIVLLSLIAKELFYRASID
jgi:hypothetical protein